MRGDDSTLFIVSCFEAVLELAAEPHTSHLAVHMFPDPVEQKAKLALLSLAGAAGNVLGLLIAGVCMIQSYK